MAWTLINKEGSSEPGGGQREYLISSVSDIASPPGDDENIPAGSTAYTADLSVIYMKDGAGVWTEVTG